MRDSTEPPRDAGTSIVWMFLRTNCGSARAAMMTGCEKSAVARATTHYENLTFLQLLFRYLWPFWLFKDASRGDRHARAAAYRHNRSMRAYLPGYLVKWVFGSLFAFALTAGFESLGDRSGARPRRSRQPLCGHGRRRRHRVCGQPLRPVRDQLLSIFICTWGSTTVELPAPSTAER